MKSIGMVGVNTCHAHAFAGVLNGNGRDAPLLPDARITHVWVGDHAERLAELEEIFGSYQYVVTSPEANRILENTYADSGR